MYSVSRGWSYFRERGFTLIEVLIAMGIFLVGIICVAALFPASVAVQRDTVESLMGQQVARRAEVELQAIASAGVDATDPLTYHHDATSTSRNGTLARYSYNLNPPLHSYDGDPRRTLALSEYRQVDLGGGNPLPAIPARPEDTEGNANSGLVPVAPLSNYPVSNDHGFRAILGRDLTSYPSTGDALYRDYYWFPFISANGDANDPSTDLTWSGFVIVMHRQPQMNVPQVRYTDADEAGTDRIDWSAYSFDNDKDNDGTPDLIRPGDLILADTGVVCRVVLADKNGCTVESTTLGRAGLVLRRIYFAVNVNDIGQVKREGPSTVAWIEGPFSLPVQDPGP